MGVRIYPVVEVKDFVYGHRYGWLDALLQTAEGFMLRPKPELGRAFAMRLSLRHYLFRRYGASLNGGIIMMDHCKKRGSMILNYLVPNSHLFYPPKI